jgi:large subunit ribosomal protein L4
LRRDIIKNVFEYWQNKDRYILKKAKGFGDVAGSGKKPVPQKGRGAARQGNKRAPQRKGGGVAHGPVPRCLGFPINNKVRLLAIKTMLSAKLFEERLVFIDSEELEYPKTTFLKQILEPYGFDKLTFLTGAETCHNFSMAARNISNLNVKNAQQFNVPDMLMSDYIFVTKEGMSDLESVLERRHENYFRNRKVSSSEHIEHIIAKRQNPWERDIMLPILEAAESPADQKPLDFVTPSLQQYIDDLRSLQLSAQERQKVEELKRAE